MPAILTDFGLARAIATGSKYTRTGEAVGTPAYMSPEQARGETATLTPATDVWALGCVLYELLAGRQPFAGDTAAGVIGQVLSSEPPRLRALRPDVPAGLEPILRACLSKFAGQRYPSARELGDDLDRVLRGAPTHAARRARRGRLARVAAALALSGLAAAAVLGLGRGARPAPGTADDVPALVARALARRWDDARQAAALLVQALARAPDQHAARLELGVLQWSLGARDEARATWEQIPTADPSGPMARLYAALLPALDGHEVLALENLDRLGAEDGPLALAARGAAAAERRDWPAARTLLADVHGWVGPYYRGFVEVSDPAGDPRVALRELDAAIAADAPPFGARLHRAIARLDLGETAGALEDADAALRLRPGAGEALATRAAVWVALGRPADALADCEDALRHDPGRVEALVNRAIARAHLGDLAGAIAGYGEALAVRPGHARTLAERATLRERSGDLAGAIADLSEAIRLHPDLFGVRFARATLRAGTGDLAGAREDLDVAVRLRPTDAHALANRAEVRLRDGDAAGAEADCTAALALEPRSVALRVNRAAARRKLGRPEDGVADCSDALRLDPTSVIARFNRAICAADAGQGEAAEADLLEAIRQDPTHRSARGALGQMRARRNDWRGACEAFEGLLALLPAGDETDGVRAQLEEWRAAAAGER